MTLGVDYRTKVIRLDNENVKLQVWDTAGQEKYESITKMYYKGAQGIVIAYSSYDRDSFMNVQKWVSQIKAHARENVRMVLVANKCDMAERFVTFEEGKVLADKYGMRFFESSAKNDINVAPIFHVSRSKGIYLLSRTRPWRRISRNQECWHRSPFLFPLRRRKREDAFGRQIAG
jgi:small GTP-binding protein